MLDIAHRGARCAAPENTLEAIAKAAELGADAVELDVQLTADGAVVVFHDDDLVRCTDARERFPERKPWRVSDFTAAEIRTLDAGSWFADELLKPPAERQPWLASLTDGERSAWVRPQDLARYACGAVKVPLLADCLKTCADLALAVHVELKTVPRFYPGLAEKVVALVRRARMQGTTLVSSFDHQQLAKVHALAPELKTGVLTSDRLFRPAEYLARLRASAYNPGCSGELDTVGFGAVTGQLDRGTIAEVTGAGYDVYVWTENDPVRMSRLIQAGVSGIYTDFPGRLRALLESGAGAT